jgi:hypothetical protein
MSEISPGAGLRNPIVPPLLLAAGSLLWRVIDWAEKIQFLMNVKNEDFTQVFQSFVSFGWIILIVVAVVWGHEARKRSSQNRHSSHSYKMTWGLVISTSALAFMYGVLLTVYMTEAVPVVLVGNGSTSAGCAFQMDTSKLTSFGSKYYFAGACGISDPTVDRVLQTGITISQPFTITRTGGTEWIFARYSPSMAAAYGDVGHVSSHGVAVPGLPPRDWNLWYVPLLIPTDVDVTKIARLADLKKMGGKIVTQAEFQ